jgi:hypothetical protein
LGQPGTGGKPDAESALGGFRDSVAGQPGPSRGQASEKAGPLTSGPALKK